MEFFMKPCAEYEKILHLELYNELSREEREALKAHLEICPACRRERKNMSGFMAGIQAAVPRARLAPAAAARMRASIVERAVPVSFWAHCRQWVSSIQLAPMLTAACLVILIWSGMAGYDAYFGKDSHQHQIALHEAEKKMLMENYEVISNLEILEEMEVLDKLVQVTDAPGTSGGRLREGDNQVHRNKVFSNRQVA